jgi:ABC-2 type transport system ATP-binding protein
MNDATQAVAIEFHQVTRRFGSKVALDDVSLDIPRGGVFGLVGENGAGKTTLLKHALGLFKAREGGRVRVFGLDPVADPPGVLSRVGYLSEDRDLPEWMRVDELLRYSQAFYPKWDERYAEELRAWFDLDLRQRIRDLSRGQRAQAGLLVALAHRPELLILDEPSSGLDPVVRRDILGAIVRTVGDEGRTVLFSSHLLDEVERVADRVAMLHKGRVVMCDELEAIKAAHRRVTLHFVEPQASRPALPGALACEGDGREWTVLCNGRVAELRAAAAAAGAEVVEEQTATLEEIFVARVKG